VPTAESGRHSTLLSYGSINLGLRTRLP